MKVIHSDSAPKTVGPYSQAVEHNGLLYSSGQIGLIPEKGELAGSDVETQAVQVTKNLSAVLKAAGAATTGIIKCNIYLLDMADFPKVNAIYADWLGEHRPARATVAVAQLPLGAKIEIDLIATVS